MTAHLEAHGDNALVHRLALRLVEHLRMLTIEIDELAAEITQRVTIVAPSLLAIVGCGPLTAAKIVGETAQVHRFRSKDAFARHNGTAPLPVWSSNKQRHRLAHRESATQHRPAPHRDDPSTPAPARELMQRRQLNGDGGMEALRILKRRLSDVVYRAMLTDQNSTRRRLTEELETEMRCPHNATRSLGVNHTSSARPAKRVQKSHAEHDW